MHQELTVLDRTGDVKITWDATSAADCDRARQEVAALKAAGFLFFRLEGVTADDPIAAGTGELIARIVAAEEVVATSVPDQPTTEPEPVAKRRGRPKKSVPAPPALEAPHHIAVRPVRGG